MTTKLYSNEASKDYFISGTTNENIALFSYNCYNQLIEADTNGVVSNYSYAPDGLRHSKTVGEDTTTFVYDNSNVVEEITQDGTNKYYRGFEIIKNGNNLYYIYNGQGDVTILTDNAGTTVADYSFDAYGNQSEENDVYNPFGYRGEYTDEETGFIYLRARYYDTETGRFVSEDPIRDGLNWYVYCGGNPIVFVDPLGLFDYNDRLSVSNKYNKDVAVLQNELAYHGYYSGEIDGYFGQQTLNAVNAYKKAMGLGNTGKDWGVVGLQTWNSLGLTYLTKDDVAGGVTIKTIGLKQYKDITETIRNAIGRDYNEFKSKGWNPFWFKNQVGDYGIWNLKYRDGDVCHWEMNLGITFPGYTTKMLLNGRFVTVENVGNITYGYLGMVSGLPKDLLYWGSGANDNKNHSNSQDSNELEDRKWIDIGISWYNREHRR